VETELLAVELESSRLSEVAPELTLRRAVPLLARRGTSLPRRQGFETARSSVRRWLRPGNGNREGLGSSRSCTQALCHYQREAIPLGED
jgi:hypothetical protein